MKKMTRLLALILALTTLSTVAVGAAEEKTADVYDITPVSSDYQIAPLTAANATPTTREETVEEVQKTIHEDVVKFTLEFTGEDDVEYVVFLLSPGATVPTKDSIRYIDQKADGTNMSFTIYPDNISKPGTYTIYLSSTSNKFAPVGSFTVLSVGYEVSGNVAAHSDNSSWLAGNTSVNISDGADVSTDLKTTIASTADKASSESYSFDEIEAGEYTVSFAKPHFVPWSVTATVTDEDVSVPKVDLYQWGDVNKDASTTAYDASLILQDTVGLTDLDDYQLTIGNVNGQSDGTTAYDASLILQLTVGLITSFPAESN